MTDAERIAQIRKIIATYKPDVFYAETVAFLLSALSASQARVAELESRLINIAATCHREKWQFESAADQPTSEAFRVLHDIGDMAIRSLTKDKSE